jgi:hypothetical protein
MPPVSLPLHGRVLAVHTRSLGSRIPDPLEVLLGSLISRLRLRLGPGL